MSERPTALITGASGGLGLEFAKLLAERGHDLVLVARSGSAMEELAQYCEERFGVAATVLVKDLSLDAAAGQVADQVAQRGIDVDVLINDAGFTQRSPFATSDERVMLALLRVNMEALTVLSRRFLPAMIARGRGRIVNLASNAAFQPGPGMASDRASKSFVLNLSIALAEEVRGTGVTVTALCPGPTATDFQARAAMRDAKLVRGKRPPSAADVAEWGWAKAERGVPFAVHGARRRAIVFGTRLLPRSVAAWLAAGANERV
ncbi:MAG: SDR family oxidoreductase [Actinomycetota bacterium]